MDELKKTFKAASTGKKTLEAVERDYIVQVLEQTNWKVSGKDSAAEILALDRSTLRARMAKLNIENRKFFSAWSELPNFSLNLDHPSCNSLKLHCLFPASSTTSFLSVVSQFLRTDFGRPRRGNVAEFLGAGAIRYVFHVYPSWPFFSSLPRMAKRVIYDHRLNMTFSGRLSMTTMPMLFQLIILKNQLDG